MKARQLEKLGIPRDMTLLAKAMVKEARRDGMSPHDARSKLLSLIGDPASHRADARFGQLATALERRGRTQQRVAAGADAPRAEPVPWRSWGRNLEAQAVKQMENASRLSVAVRGALMPDAHLGYGLPIGGVLAVDNAVIPYAVGVDIACRMKLTVLDLPPKVLESQRDRLVGAIETQTRFGMGSNFEPGRRRNHEVMDEDWSVTAVTRGLKDKAWAQLGTSGSGNHFVEFGEFSVDESGAVALGMDGPGTWLSLLSHSGSRGAGATVASHYSRLAMSLHPQLPRELRQLAWLDLDASEGQEYWAAMQLMGQYAAANHRLIHHHIADHLGASVVLDVENHHNFAWRERHDGRDLVVHRKGATPAAHGVLGVIPGSMASPCYVVRGRGSAEALNSASHGAGRVMSRRKAKLTYRWAQARDLLNKRGVHLISAGLDEVPFVYKDIDTVMSEQQDLVETLARFDPKLVKMAPGGEKAED
jgi:tRNA-splicing ligase RtcB